MKVRSYSLLAGALFLLSSCAKEFLNEKRDSKQDVPNTVAKFQNLMDNFNIINTFSTVSLGLVGAAEYTLPDAVLTTWKGNIPYETNGYLWEKEVYEGKELPDWNNAYHRILYTNLVMDIDKITPTPSEKADWSSVKGSALFVRAFSFYQLAQLFCKPYNTATATSDPGVPLRLSYAVTEKFPRGTVAEVYAQIIKDAETALELVPEKQPYVYRPNKAAVATLLARVYLQMGNYDKVRYYADLGLKSKDVLLDFNKIKVDGAALFPTDYGASMPEILFYSQINKPGSTYTGFNADKELLALYDAHDLRLKGYFTKTPTGEMNFKGSMAGPNNIFVGYTTSELVLMRAEARVRLGEVQPALDDLNRLHQFRYETNYYQPIVSGNADEVLKLVLQERRKELYFRGVRWEDLRRLNKEPQFATTLTRTAYGKPYELKPGDDRWTWALPDNEIQLSNYTQNPR